jgi:leucyl-tRNA synthetase
MTVARGTSEDAARAAALADENIARFIDGASVRKIIFVPDRLINIVVG